MSSNQKVMDLFYQAAQKYFSGRLRETKEILREVIKADPDFALAYRNLGLLHKDLGEASEAVENLEKARDLGDERTAHLCMSLGASYFMVGKYEDAIKELNEAISLDANLAISHYWLGQSHAMLWRRTRDSSHRLMAEDHAEWLTANNRGDLAGSIRSQI